MATVSPCMCQSNHAPEGLSYIFRMGWKSICYYTGKMRFTHGKIRDKRPLLNGLVVGGLSPHKAEVKGQTRVVRTHDH